jgi:hypothetical protein
MICANGIFMRNALLVLVMLLLPAVSWAQSAKQLAAILGSWEGDSKCTVTDSPCHDEHVLYQIAADKRDPEQLNLDEYKIVEGAPEFIGTLACRYHAKQTALSCTANDHDDWEFHVFGDALSGKLTIDDGKTVYRRIALHRSSKSN